MDGFSVSALTALTSTISNRALSIVTELDELVKALDSQDGSIPHLSTFSAMIRQCHQSADQLEKGLNQSSVLSPQLQGLLTRYLESCNGLYAILNKQVMRLQPSNVSNLNVTYLVLHCKYLDAYCQLFGFFVKLLYISEQKEQDAALETSEGLSTLAQVDSSSKRASKANDILLPERQSVTSGSSSKGPLPGGTQEPPPYEGTSPSSSHQAESGPFGTSSGFSKGMSSLTNSFKAMTANIWAKPDPFATAFCQAALRGDIQQMSGFLAEGANINGRNADGNTPLGCAILSNQEASVRFLLGAGADKTSNSSKLPPLFLAASVGSIEVMKLLLSQGVDVNQRSWTGGPYFCEVVESGNLAGIELLLQHGVSANTTNISGRSVLAQTVKKGNIELAKLLLRHGAEATSTDINGNSLLALAVSNEDMEMARLLLRHGANAKGRVLNGNTILMDAINKRRIEFARLLLDHGADSNARDITGNPMLVVVLKDSKLILADKVETAMLLLRHGASPNVMDSTQRSHAVCYAMETGSTELIKLLLQHGVATDKQMSSGETLLLYAMDKGKMDQAIALIEHGANPNAADKKGRTPLMQAIAKGDVSLIKLLREHGADIKQGGNVSPSDLAGVMNNPEIFRALGINVQSPSRAPASPVPRSPRPEASRSGGRPQSPPPGYEKAVGAS